MNIEIEHNPNDVLLGFQYIFGNTIDDDGNEELLEMISIGLLFFTISFIFD